MAEQGMRRIIAHWTAGAGRANSLDRSHYHRLVEFDGKIVFGTEEIADNIVTSDGDYAAHTLHLNTGSIGVSCCGMMGATEYPFDPGPAPINEVQFRAFCKMIAELALEYGIPITRETVLTHAEVQPTLGVQQRGKWDMTRLPFKLDLRGAIPVGDYMRELVAEFAGVAYSSGATPAPAFRALRFGDRGVAIADLQADLASLGYFAGRIDGDFGPLTRGALLAFQADQGLATDAIAGPATLAALAKAEPRPLRDITQDEIDAESGTAAGARMTARMGDVVGGVSLLSLGATVLENPDGAERAVGLAERAGALLSGNWPLVALVVAGLVAWVALRGIAQAMRVRRLRDAQEHRSLAR